MTSGQNHNNGATHVLAQTAISRTISMFRDNPRLWQLLESLEEKETWTLSEQDAEQVFSQLARLSSEDLCVNLDDDEDVPENKISLDGADLNNLNASMAYLKSQKGIHILKMFCDKVPDLQNSLIWQARFELAGGEEHAAVSHIFLNRLRILMAYGLLDVLFDKNLIQTVKRMLKED